MKKRYTHRFVLPLAIALVLIVTGAAFFALTQFTGKAVDSQIQDTTSYIYAGNLLASKTGSEPTNYYIQDHLGSNVKVVDGNIVGQESNFYAFGETETLVNNENNYLYAGKELDEESGLYYYGARYYDPAVGRFMAADAVQGNLQDPLSLNRYSYVKNNPLKYIDPSGNEEKKPLAVLIYSSKSPEFEKEVKQYITNYKDRYSFQIYSVYGNQEIKKMIDDVNSEIKKGEKVARVVFFDHRGNDLMFGMESSQWNKLPRIQKQEVENERVCILGTCDVGRPTEVLEGMIYISGAKYATGVDGPFWGIVRKPAKNDQFGLLIHGENGPRPADEEEIVTYVVEEEAKEEN